MRIELDTSGGVTGRGLGTVAIVGSNVTVDGRAAAALTPSEAARVREGAGRLDDVDRNAQRPHAAAADAMVYVLTIDGRRWSWTDVDNGVDSLMNIADELLAIRESRIAT